MSPKKALLYTVRDWVLYPVIILLIVALVAFTAAHAAWILWTLFGSMFIFWLFVQLEQTYSEYRRKKD